LKRLDISLLVEKNLDKGYSQLARGVPTMGGFLSFLYDLMANKTEEKQKDSVAFLQFSRSKMFY
jgi:hypothetical protein